MQGDPKILEALNTLLTSELTAINQYFLDSKMCANWGYTKLADHFHTESIDEMKHADRVIERILLLDGVPNLQRLNQVPVGESVREQIALALESELEAVANLNRGAALSLELADHASRDLFASILRDEEEHVDWLEAQLALIEDMGVENYLAQQI
jgi:bacterioferritin